MAHSLGRSGEVFVGKAVADDEHEKRMMVFRNEGMDKAAELTAMQRLQRAKPKDETWFKKSAPTCGARPKQANWPAAEAADD